jgi:hypothetical protein
MLASYIFDRACSLCQSEASHDLGRQRYVLHGHTDRHESRDIGPVGPSEDTTVQHLAQGTYYLLSPVPSTPSWCSKHTGFEPRGLPSIDDQTKAAGAVKTDLATAVRSAEDRNMCSSLDVATGEQWCRRCRGRNDDIRTGDSGTWRPDYMHLDGVGETRS